MYINLYMKIYIFFIYIYICISFKCCFNISNVYILRKNISYKCNNYYFDLLINHINENRYDNLINDIHNINIQNIPNNLFNRICYALIENGHSNIALSYMNTYINESTKTPQLEFLKLRSHAKLNQIDECFNILHNNKNSKYYSLLLKEFSVSNQYETVLKLLKKVQDDKIEISCETFSDVISYLLNTTTSLIIINKFIQHYVNETLNKIYPYICASKLINSVYNNNINIRKKCSIVDIDIDGYCQSCGTKLHKITLNENMRIDILYYLKQNILKKMNNNAHTQILKFEDMLNDQIEPYTIFIDGPNIAYHNSKGILKLEQIELIRKKLIKMGYKSIILLTPKIYSLMYDNYNNIHCINNKSNIDIYKLIKYWESLNCIYITPHSIDDDIFLLFGSICRKNIICDIITNDTMKNHILYNKYYNIWIDTCIIKYNIEKDVKLIPKPIYSLFYQRSEVTSSMGCGPVWHFPISKTRWLCLNPFTGYNNNLQIEKTWMKCG
eukprot:GHVL01044021.1.p1 GENE.GHVL01044021.1~~GHVL01044021.1.p1  ORF type:complete len:498 (+),score=132.99 GHVL01044021.1:119-1612(+)